MYRKLPLLLLAAFLVSGHFSARAQRTLGVRWQIPEDPQIAARQLQIFEDSGISLVEVSELPEAGVWQQIRERGFRVYGNLGIQFPIARTFASPDSALIAAIERKASAFLSQSSLAALGIFEYGAVRDERFIKAVTPFFRQLRRATRSEIYFIDNRFIEGRIPADHYLLTLYTGVKAPDAAILRSSRIGGFLYHPSPPLQNHLAPVKSFFQLTSAAPGKPVFFDSGWLLRMINSHPGFKSTLQSYSRDTEPYFPVPRQANAGQNSTTVIALILLLVWGSVAVHYSMSPLYRKSLFRYFHNHSFFINDIFRRHIRSPAPAVTIIIQNALLVAGCIAIISLKVWSPTGREVLFHYYPALSFLGEGMFAMALWILAGVLFFSMAGILWLYFSNKSLTSITQVAIIFAWPLHLNIIIASLAIALYASGEPAPTYLVPGALVVLITLSAFLFAAFDTASFLSKGKGRYLALTGGIYLLLIISAAGISFWSDSFWQIVSLSLSLR